MPSERSPEESAFKRVSVTGGTGTVASQFIKALLAGFPSVERITTAYRNPRSERVKRLPDSPKLRTVIGNVADPAVARALVDEGDVVYHLAGWLANTDLPDDRNEVYITNSLSTALLARLCERQGKRFVFTSSHSVYFAGEYAGRIRADTFRFRQDFVEWIDNVKGAYCGLADELTDAASSGRPGDPTNQGKRDFGTVAQAVADIHARWAPPFEPTIYDNDGYHIYCLTKLLAERFALEHGGIVLRLGNVYGPGDDSVQAVGEACHRMLEAEPDDVIGIIRPFKKLVPAYLGDINKALVRAAAVRLAEGASPVFTVASQEHYLKEDALLRAVGTSLNEVRGTDHEYRIEELPTDDPPDFTYDLSRLREQLLNGEGLTGLHDGLAKHLAWLTARMEKAEE